MPLNLWGSKMSPCTQRVAIVLLETGAHFKYHDVDISKGAHKAPEYLAKQQPFGQVPSLWDGDYHIYESRAINVYVASTYDKSGKLFPEDAKARGVVEQWVNIEIDYYHAITEITHELVFKPWRGVQSDLTKIPALEKSMHEVFAVINKHLEGKKYFAGANFSVADAAYIPYTHVLVHKIEQYKNVFDAYPNIKTWWHTVSGRHAVIKALAGDY